MNARALSVGVCAAIAAAALGVHSWLGASESTAAEPTSKAFRMEDEDLALARTALRYFHRNRQATGLVSSAAAFPATTMWDVGSQIAGLMAARELGLMEPGEFDPWIDQTLASLSRLPLYHDELPNKAYNAATLIPVAYGQLQKRQEIGFSALDLARLVRWLDILAAKYPGHAAAAHAVTAHWNRSRLVRDGVMMGVEAHGDGESWNQEGRYGYEQYAAVALESPGGARAGLSSDAWRDRIVVDVEGVPIAADHRDVHVSDAHNYVTSEPFILDGLETGFRALPAGDAARLLLAQQRRYERTGIITTWSEDNLDRAPWFLYNCIFVDRRSWATVDSSGRSADEFRGSSVKAAVGWHVLFRTRYTERAYERMRLLADPQQGVFAGFYEQTGETNRALTLNTNGVVLEALLRARVGRPLVEWAHLPVPVVVVAAR